MTELPPRKKYVSAAWLSASCSAWTCTTLLSQILHYKFKITPDIYQSDQIQDSLSCGLFLDICHYAGCVRMPVLIEQHIRVMHGKKVF